MNFYEWTCAYFISETKYIMKVISLCKNSSFHFLADSESLRLSFCLSISASVMCLHLSSGSNHGYLSSLVGTLVSSVIVSVHVDILGISNGSIGLSYARALGLKVEGVTLSCKY